VRLQADEAEAHAARLQVLQKKAGRCLWLELEAAD
jgi:DNA polymerase-3 subunit epsilon